MTDLPWKLSSIGQLAILLEASSPKPGNVSRLRRFSDTGYRHFLASATLMSRGLHLSALRGISLSDGKIQEQDVQIGKLIHTCALDVFTGLNRLNTLMGTILLHVPLSVALGASIHETERFDVASLKRWLALVIENTTNEDAVYLYRAFHLVRPESSTREQDGASWSDFHDRYDIGNPQVYDNLRADKITLVELCRKSADVDAISKEWATHFDTTLSVAVPYLSNLAKGLEDIEEAAVRTFIWLLSKEHDGLIVKKAGHEQAERVRLRAEQIVSGGFNEEDILGLDETLRQNGNLLNPGTTADMVSAALYCRLVEMDIDASSQ